MCGIAGFTALGAPPEDGEGVLHRMTRSLTHRGPDDEGFHVAPGVFLGHRRLSIIDLDSGRQPQQSEDGQVVVVFNGEIYNYVELREELRGHGVSFRTASDTEVLLEGYRHWGEEVLSRLNGMFAFAIWDGRDQSLLLARDRMGQKPLYYANTSRGLVFGSEMKALLAHPWIERDISHSAVRKYLLYDSVPTPHSIFEGVQKLPAGAMGRWSDGKMNVRSYWDMNFPEAPEGDLESLSKQLWTLLEEAVRLRLRSDVPLGVFLSGGIDSSAILALMATHMPAEEIRTFSIGFHDPSFDESSYARRVAEHFGTQHQERILDPETMVEILPRILSTLDEPMADGSLIPTYLLSEFTREHVTVALGGDGGDELFLGYPTFQAHKVARQLRFLPSWVFTSMMEPVARLLPVSTRNISFDYKVKRFLRGMRFDPFARHFVWIGGLDPLAQHQVLHPEFLQGCGDDVIFEDVEQHRQQVSSRDEYDTLSYLYSKLYMGDDILVKVDRASMAHGLEVRAPFLDHQVVDFVTALPSQMKLDGYQMKAILKKMLRGRVPDEVIDRPKKGFGIPIAAWLKGPLLSWARDLLSSQSLRDDGIFNPAGVQALLDEHVAGRADHRKALWSILVFQLWREEFGRQG